MKDFSSILKGECKMQRFLFEHSYKSHIQIEICRKVVAPRFYYYEKSAKVKFQ